MHEDPGIPLEALQTLVHRLLESSCAAGQYEHALGIALEAQETDKVQYILQKAAGTMRPPLLKYAVQALVTTVTSKSFRLQALTVVAKFLQQQFVGTNKQAAYDLVVVYQLLQQPADVADVLSTLLHGSHDDEALLGLQLCFDLMDSADTAFCRAVSEQLTERSSTSTSASTSTSTNNTDQQQQQQQQQQPSFYLEQAQRILVGGFGSELALQFLHKQSHADRLQMEHLKKALEERSSGSRSSILHNAAVLTHSYLYAGTTNDSFLRDYLDWMKKASHW